MHPPSPCPAHPSVAQSYSQPWQNFAPHADAGDLGYPSASHVDLHAPADERAGFLYDDRGSGDYQRAGGGPARLPDIGSVRPLPAPFAAVAAADCS